MQKFTCCLAAVAALTLSMAGAASAHEHPDWQQHDRAGLDHQQRHQDRRSAPEAREHDMSRGGAATLSRGDYTDRGQGHGMANPNGGHPAPDQGYALNRQANDAGVQLRP